LALFSFFGKKKSQADNSVEAKDVSQTEPKKEPAPVEDTTETEAHGILRAQRDIARMTSEKIDAIESEIARDILKSPKSSETSSTADAGSEEAAVLSGDDSPNSLFHTTLIRVDKETMILFREDMDE